MTLLEYFLCTEVVQYSLGSKYPIRYFLVYHLLFSIIGITSEV